MANGKVKEVDRGWKRIRDGFRAMARGGTANDTGVWARVGVFGADADAPHEGSDGAESGELTNAQLATIHEFGAKTQNGKIPARSFMRSTWDENESKYAAEQKKIAARAVTPQQYLAELHVLADRYRADIIRKISAGIEPPLSDATIAARERRGNKETIPLVVTGQLRDSIGVESKIGPLPKDTRSKQ